MNGIIDVVGPNHALAIFGVKLVGATSDNAKKLLFTLVFVLLVLLIAKLLRGLTRGIFSRPEWARAQFWSRQLVNVFAAVVLIFGVTSIWFDDPARLSTAFGLVTAGLAFALQRVITALAGYIVILRGKTFNVGDRIVMGGVRGDVIALDFTKTTIMEMGQPPPVQTADPAMWVASRQYTGRIVTVSNAQIFEEPVYNYTRDFPFLWEEMRVPIPYGADRDCAERILLQAAVKHSVKVQELGEAMLKEMQRRYFMKGAEIRPRVYVRLTDNWVEMTVRLIVAEHGTREVKDAMSREILAELEKANIPIASSTMQISGIEGGPRIAIESAFIKTE
jgi:small-conductance mechanosensitive channel